jgi:hypothetical protein
MLTVATRGAMEPTSWVEALKGAQSAAGGSSGDRGLRPTPVLFALLALICFGSTVFSGTGTLLLVVGVVLIITAFYAWMIL